MLCTVTVSTPWYYCCVHRYSSVWWCYCGVSYCSLHHGLVLWAATVSVCWCYCCVRFCSLHPGLLLLCALCTVHCCSQSPSRVPHAFEHLLRSATVFVLRCHCRARSCGFYPVVQLLWTVSGQIAERQFAECHFAECISSNVILPMCFLPTCQKVEMLKVEMQFADMPFWRSARSRNVYLTKLPDVMAWYMPRQKLLDSCDFKHWIAEASPGIDYRGKRRRSQGMTKATSGTTHGGKIRNGRGDPRQLMVGKQGTQMRPKALIWSTPRQRRVFHIR